MSDDSGRVGFDQLREWVRTGALRTSLSVKQIDECIKVNKKHIKELNELWWDAQHLSNKPLGIGEGLYLNSADALARKFQLKAHGGPNSVTMSIQSFKEAAEALGDLLDECRTLVIAADENAANEQHRAAQS